MNWDKDILPKPDIENLRDFYLPALDELRLGWIPDGGWIGTKSDKSSNNGDPKLIDRGNFGPKHYNVRAKEAADEIDERMKKLSDKAWCVCVMKGCRCAEWDLTAHCARMGISAAKKEFYLALEYMSGWNIKQTDYGTWRSYTNFRNDRKNLSKHLTRR